MALTISLAQIPNQDAARVVSVFCESFYDYPVFRFVLGYDNPQYDEQLPKLIGLFVTNRVLRNEPMFGIVAGSELVAAATTSIPDDAEPLPEFKALRDAVWTELGAEAEARYALCTVAWQPLAPRVPQWHVNMIGVRRAYQRTGLAGRLLRHVHELSRSSSSSQGVSLTTEDARNVSFYQHLGYEIFDRGSIVPGIDTWGFFRRNGQA